MKFGPVLLDQAAGKILAHHITGADGRVLFRKGKPLSLQDIEDLRLLGRTSVYAAEVEAGDVGEDQAATRIAQTIGGPHLQPSRASVGRVNLQAACLGVLHVDIERLLKLNEIEGITAATRYDNSVLKQRQTAGTIKIIPFAIPEENVRKAEKLLEEGGPLLDLIPLPDRAVALILSGSPSAREKTMETFVPPLEMRIEALGSHLMNSRYIPILEEVRGEEDLMQAIRAAREDGAELVILAGETAIMDRQDMAPRAVDQLGGEVVLYGAPVDPGSLLMLAYLGEMPILGAPGCARSRKPNVLDWVLPRLLVGERPSTREILALGHGGLLEGLQEGVSWRERLPNGG